MCLIPEPRNPVDPQAILVTDAHGVVMGYVRGEQAQWIGTLLRDARVTAAIFQQPTKYGCVIRLGLDGEEPIVPPPAPRAEAEPEWWPDEMPVED